MDGLPGREGVFLPCSFWLANVLASSSGERKKRANCSSACSIYETISDCSPRSTIRSRRRQLGNFPQAFTHVALVNGARILSEEMSCPLQDN